MLTVYSSTSYHSAGRLADGLVTNRLVRPKVEGIAFVSAKGDMDMDTEVNSKIL